MLSRFCRRATTCIMLTCRLRSGISSSFFSATEVAPDVRLKLAVRPVELYVTAPGAKRVTSFFGKGGNVETGDIGNLYSDAAMQFQSQGLAGLQHLTEERSVMDLEITVEAPIIVLPAKDNEVATTLALILDLGVLELNSILDGAGAGEEPGQELSAVDAAREQAYDRFDIKLTKVQVLLTRRGDPWREALSIQSSPMHLLDQTDFNLNLQKCLQVCTLCAAWAWSERGCAVLAVHYF